MRKVSLYTAHLLSFQPTDLSSPCMRFTATQLASPQPEAERFGPQRAIPSGIVGLWEYASWHDSAFCGTALKDCFPVQILQYFPQSTSQPLHWHLQSHPCNMRTQCPFPFITQYAEYQLQTASLCKGSKGAFYGQEWE